MTHASWTHGYKRRLTRINLSSAFSSNVLSPPTSLASLNMLYSTMLSLFTPLSFIVASLAVPLESVPAQLKARSYQSLSVTLKITDTETGFFLDQLSEGCSTLLATEVLLTGPVLLYRAGNFAHSQQRCRDSTGSFAARSRSGTRCRLRTEQQRHDGQR